VDVLENEYFEWKIDYQNFWKKKRGCSSFYPKNGFPKATQLTTGKGKPWLNKEF